MKNLFQWNCNYLILINNLQKKITKITLTGSITIDELAITQSIEVKILIFSLSHFKNSRVRWKKLMLQLKSECANDMQKRAKGDKKCIPNFCQLHSDRN